MQLYEYDYCESDIVAKLIDEVGGENG